MLYAGALSTLYWTLSSQFVIIMEAWCGDRKERRKEERKEEKEG